MRILILGGTGEARILADKLVKMGHAVTTSLAGRTSAPLLPAGEVHIGGFGGAQVRDLVWHADAIAIRYAPRIVMLYAGDNDIDAGRSPQQVLHDVQRLVARLRQALPRATIAYVAIKPSPARVSQLAAQREANALIEDWTRGERRVAFIDVATPMLDADGLPREELFLADRLHMNADGYALWRGVIAAWLH
jgi:lysophospholipase L1-like esterase